MKKFMTWLADSFSPKANELLSKAWLAGLAGAMQRIVPFIMTGSIVYIYNVLVSFFPVLPDISPIANFSFGIITIITAFYVTSQIMEKTGNTQYVINGGLAAVCVLIMASMPTGDVAESLPAFMGNIGPTGIAVGVIIGLYEALILYLWGKLRFLEGSSVPDFLAAWLNLIIPNFISLLIMMVLINNFHLSVYDLIITCFMPVSHILNTLPGFIIMSFLMSFFFTLGISTWLWNAVTTPVFTAGIAANIAAVAAGGAATYIVTNETWYTLAFITMGGTCATLTLNIWYLFAKSKKLKTLGRIFLAPSIFNINEPIVFGTVVFNPILMIPAWIASIVGPIYVWILMKGGLLNIPAMSVQTGQIPAPFSSWLVTQDMRAFLWWALLFVIYGAIWYPFFKVYDKQCVQEELEAAKQEAVDENE